MAVCVIHGCVYEGGAVQGGEDEGVTERVVLPGSWWAGHGCTSNTSE